MNAPGSGSPWSARRLRNALLAAAVGLGVLAAPVHAQETTLEGTITSAESGEALAGVTVELVELGLRTVTDAAGRYRFTDVPRGSYTLRVVLIGHHPVERSLNLESGGVALRDLTLQTSAIPLSPLSILLERTRMVGDGGAGAVPGSAHFLSRADIDAQKDAHGDVNALLRQVPGVTVQEEDGYGLRPNIGLRGTGSERSSSITLMEDGVLIAPAPYAAPAAYYFPVAGRMEAIEVRKGSSQIRYGPRTIGGALNLISTSVPDELTIRAEAAGGEDGTRKLHAHAGETRGGFGWLLETFQLRSDGFKVLDTGGSTGFDIADYVAKVRVASDPRSEGRYQELELKGHYYDELSNETYLGLTDPDFAESPVRRYAASQRDAMSADQRQLQARYFLRLTPAFDFSATLYHNGFARNWYKLQSVEGRSPGSVLADPEAHAAELAILRGGESGPDALTVRANNREYYARGVQTTFGWRTEAAGARHGLELGIRYHRDQEDRFQHDDGYRMSGGRMLLTGPGAPGSQANRVSDASAWAFYLQDRVDIGALTLVPGVRHERIDFVRTDYEAGDAERASAAGEKRNDVRAWIPGVGATLELSSSARVFAGVHRGFAPPGPGADRQTRPESSTNYELGGRFARSGVRAQLVGFFSDYTNILGASTLATGGDGSGDLHNGGAVEVYGLEASAEYDVLRSGDGSLRLPLRAAYTFTSAEFRTAFESDYAPWGSVRPGDELPYTAAHQLYLSAGAERGRLSGRLESVVSSAMRTEAGQGPIPEGTGTDAYALLHLATEYALAPRAALHLAVRNLTDRSFVAARHPHGVRPTLPRTLHLGVRVSN